MPSIDTTSLLQASSGCTIVWSLTRLEIAGLDLEIAGLGSVFGYFEHDWSLLKEPDFPVDA